MSGKSGYSPFIFQLQEAYPILIGDLDPSGNLQANIIHAPSGKRGNGSLCANHSFVIQRTKTKSFFTDNLRTKMMVAIMEGKWQNVQMTADYKVENENKCLCTFPLLCLQGRDYTASLTAGNPDLLSGTGMAVCHYLQVVSPKFSCPLDKKLSSG